MLIIIGAAFPAFAQNADLVISQVGAPASAVPGEQIFISNTVTNQGQGSAGFFEVGLYLSRDAKIEPADQFLTSRSLNSLLNGASHTSSTIVVIPANTAPGQYFIGAWADYSGRVQEANEANNIGVDAITVEVPAPDLIVAAVSAPTSASPGQTITVANTIENQGTGKANSFSAGFYLSSDASINSSDLLLDIRSINSLNAGQSDDSETSILIPNNVAPGNYYLGVWADNFQEISEKSENNNTASRTLSVVTKPDLVITTFTTPAAASPGQIFTVANTVQNQGTASSGACRVGFYLSTDQTITAGDVFLGSRSVGALAANASSSANTSITIPTSTALGNYFIGAWVDDQQSVSEAVESNNIDANAMVLTAPTSVDLTITAVDAPAQASFGQSIIVANTVKNQGAAAAGQFEIGFYLSTDNTITTADFFLGARTVTSLASGASNAANTTVTIPVTLAPGNYFLGAWADHFNAANETNETNNSATDAITILGLPDLIVTAVDAPPQASPGQSINVANTIKNQGSTNAGVFEVGIYLSTDNLITTSDILLGTRTVNNLSVGASDATSTGVTLPGSVTTGRYYIGVWADYLGSLSETNETNNTASDTLRVIGQPDLTATNIDAPAQVTAGQTISIPNTVLNSGTADAGGFQVGIYLSTDNTISGTDLLLTTRTVSSLKVGASNADITSVTIPASANPGPNYVGVWADNLNAVAESNDNNNTTTKLVTILGQADLAVTAIGAPSQVMQGQSFFVTNTVKNIGSAAAGSFVVGLYLSTDNVINSTDLLLAARTVNSLAAGAADTASTAVAISSTTLPGNYFLIVWADHLGAITEFNDNDNTASKTLSIQGRPDLVVTNVAAPGLLNPGQIITVANTVANLGNATTGAFQVGIYLSTDDVITATDILLGARNVNGLAIGASEAASTTVSVPAAITPGNYFVGVWADHNRTVAESDESNNAAIDAAASGGQSELVVTAVSPPPQAAAGQSITVSNTITNQGNLEAGSFQVGFYLSSDTLITGADIFLGNRTVSSLAVGAKDAAGTAVAIPFTVTPGNYFIGVEADYLNRMSESNETNNTASSPLTIAGTSDLIVTAVDAPVQANSGQVITVANTIKNQGTSNAAAFQVGFYLSLDSVITTTDMQIGTRTINSLAVGASNADNTAITLPSSTIPSSYYIGVFADYLNTAIESNENNNAGQDEILLSGLPDLIVTAMAAPKLADPGQHVIVSTTVKNQGSVPAGSFVVGIYLSTDTLITSGDRLLEIRSVTSLLDGASSQEDTEIIIPASITPGNYYLGVLADIFASITEGKEDNNAARQLLAIATEPDLLVLNVDAPSAAVPGQSFNLTTTLRNQGTGHAGALRVAFYLSQDTVITTTDSFLGFRNVNELQAGKSTSESITLTIPGSTALGNYFLGVWADDQNAIVETNEDNNIRNRSLEIRAPAQIDLVITAAAAPAQANPGQAILITNTVQNQGAAAAGNFSIGFYLSTDNVITTADLLLGSRLVNNLATGASDAANTSVTIPSTVAAGNYFTGVWVDNLNFVVETAENNNTVVKAISILPVSQPDLAAVELDAVAQAGPGQTINVKNVVKNLGGAPAEGFQVGLYLSTDNVITSDDILLEIRSVVALAAGAADTAITAVTIPSSTPRGNYFIGMQADYTEMVAEANETNNTQAKALVVGGQADLLLTVLNIPAQINPGETLTITHTVKNQGTITAANFTIGFYLSTDSIITSADRLLDVYSVNNLAPGKESTGTLEVVIAADLASGQYYLGAWADFFQEVSENSETNNTVARPLAIGAKADLVITDLTLPPSASPGFSMTVLHTIKNAGVLPAPAFRIGYYLSANNVIDAADLLLGSRPVTPLAVGAASSTTTTLNIPASVAVGNYFLGVWVDDQNAVEEISDGNNQRAESLPIVQAVPVDLIVTAIEAPAEADAGAAIMVQNTVKNQGTQAAPGFRLGLYLSPDAVIAPTDILIGFRQLNALGVNAADAANTSISIPASVKSGKYFLGAWADDGNAIFEPNESNNVALDTITVISKGNRPPLAKAGGPYAAPHNTFVKFDATASSDPDGDALNFLWQFGDGVSGTGAEVTHFYTSDSTYTVILIVTDERGGITSDTTQARIFNRAPIAKINGPYKANRATVLQFSSEGSSDPDEDPLEFSWDFGDFSTGFGPSPRHLYTEIDTVKVILTVTDGHGGRTHDTTLVFIANLPPVAHFTSNPPWRLRAPGDTVRFNASASRDMDGTVQFYIWNFGDGSKPDSSGSEVWHLYKAFGDFFVQLRVVDNEGASGDTTTSLRVRVDDRNGHEKIPEQFALAQNYPNPYGRAGKFAGGTASTTIGYAVPAPAWVSLKIYNFLGQTVRTLVAAQHAVGFYEITWDGRDEVGREVPSGIYFYELESRQARLLRKMMIVR